MLQWCMASQTSSRPGWKHEELHQYEFPDITSSKIPKQCPQTLPLRCSPDRTQLLVMNNTPLFFSNRDGQWFPTLRLLHQYPDMMKKARVDQGAIKFVLSGANIMCPGLTSPGATLHDEVPPLFGLFRIPIPPKSCHYCGRKDVSSALYTSRPLFIPHPIILPRCV